MYLQIRIQDAVIT